jgi:hypothetical protein
MQTDLCGSPEKYGLYCMVSVTLNGVDVPVPEVDATA